MKLQIPGDLSSISQTIILQFLETRMIFLNQRTPYNSQITDNLSEISDPVNSLEIKKTQIAGNLKNSDWKMLLGGRRSGAAMASKQLEESDNLRISLTIPTQLLLFLHSSLTINRLNFLAN